MFIFYNKFNASTKYLIFKQFKMIEIVCYVEYLNTVIMYVDTNLNHIL